MAMKSSSTSCAICDNSNLASICANCVNYRLSERNLLLRSMNNARNSLYRKLEGELQAKRKMDEQLKWRVHQNERIAKLKERLHLLKEQLAQDKVKVVKRSADLKVKQQALDSASVMLKRNRVELLEKFCRNLNCTQNLGHMAVTSDLLHKQSMIIKQICKLFPMRRVISDNKDGFSGPYDLICNARLPRGLDPHSVPSAELAASLGYMVQLLNLVVPKLAAPALHNSGFAGSCSRIWQRNSYWDARPSSQSTEYPLFIPRQNFCSSVGEASWSDRSSSNFGVASVDSERKPCLDASGSSSFNYSSASPHSLETHKDLQKGISMLKKSVACITAFCSNSLCLEEHADASTFEAFAKLLATLSSSREMRGALSLKMASPRSDTQGQRFNRLVWDANSSTSSSGLVESMQTTIMYQPSNRDNLLSNADASYFYPTEIGDNKKSETLEGWDIVERPVFPPTSQGENVDHWMRAMFIDARKK